MTCPDTILHDTLLKNFYIVASLHFPHHINNSIIPDAGLVLKPKPMSLVSEIHFKWVLNSYSFLTQECDRNLC